MHGITHPVPLGSGFLTELHASQVGPGRTCDTSHSFLRLKSTIYGHPVFSRPVFPLADCSPLPGSPHTQRVPRHRSQSQGPLHPQPLGAPPAAAQMAASHRKTCKRSLEPRVKTADDKSYVLGNKASHPATQRGWQVCELVWVSSVPSAQYALCPGKVPARAQSCSLSPKLCAKSKVLPMSIHHLLRHTHTHTPHSKGM